MLEALNISKTYTNDSHALQVLKNVDLKVEKGDVLAIVGPSGAGKSTLLHILGGLDRPTRGQVLLEGQDIYSLNDRQRSQLRNQKVGFVFQFYHLLPEFTALENVLLPYAVKTGLPTAESRQKGLALLKEVGLKERAQHRPGQLSGGEQQRVAIARSLINEPDIIFCDEPTGNLDSQNGQGIIDLLLNLNVAREETLVIVTHDEDIARRSKRIIHMRDGRLI